MNLKTAYISCPHCNQPKSDSKPVLIVPARLLNFDNDFYCDKCAVRFKIKSKLIKVKSI